MTNEQLEAITTLFKENLESLNLRRCDKITNEGLKSIAQNLQNLESLNLRLCHKITNEGLKSIAQNLKNLESLDISFCNNITDEGLKLVDLSDVHVGDKLISRIEIEVDRDMEFVHLKDMRASGLEPINVLSGYKWKGGLGYYESTADLATHFFFDYLPRGKYIFEYPVRVAHAGSFSNGIATLQSMYAPEFSSHSGGLNVTFKQ